MLTYIKSTLRVGNTLVLETFMCGGKHPSNIAADKKEWPVYMMIGNLSSKIRQMPPTHSILNVALLTNLIKNHNIAQKRVDEQCPRY